jgi:hypothetical protein
MERDGSKPVRMKEMKTKSMKTLGQTRWMLGICAVLGGCAGATPSPESATGARAEVDKPATSVAPENVEQPSRGAAPGAASQAPASAIAAPPDSAPGAPTAAAFPDLVESPGSPEIEPAAELMRRRQWIAAQVRLGKLFPAFDTSGPIDAVLAAHVLYGRSCAEVNDAPCAEREHNRAIALWEAPGTAAALQGGNDAAGRERLTRALSAVGEALFFVAEKKRAQLDNLRMPSYKGESTKDGVTSFVQTNVADWVKKKTALVEETEKAYAKIFDLKPAPLARWAVDASARAAQIWGKFNAEVRAAPIPEAWRRGGKIAGSLTTEELRNFYYGSLDQAAEPLKVRARAAYERCRDTADRTQHSNEYSRTCVAWLEKTAGAPAATTENFPRAR